MKKIPTLYVRDFDTYKVDPTQLTPGCEWVLAGDGIPTRMYDGVCIKLAEDGTWWARREVKPGKRAPGIFVLEDADPFTGKLHGWEPMEMSPWQKHFRDALEHDERFWEEVVVLEGEESDVGTYELIGPKINSNPERVDVHRIVRHGRTWIGATENATPVRLVEIAGEMGWKGIVWHHKDDARMAKLKVRDLP